MSNNTRGGKRPGAGRPKGTKGPDKVQLNLRVLPETAAKLREIGKGSASRGMELLIKRWGFACIPPVD